MDAIDVFSIFASNIMVLNPSQIETIQNYFASQPVLHAYLFGSFAKGSADRDSDVDLLVELDYNNMRGGLQFLKMQLDLQNILNIKVDLVSINGLSPEIAPMILSSKKEIYAR